MIWLDMLIVPSLRAPVNHAARSTAPSPYLPVTALLPLDEATPSGPGK